MVHLFVVCGHQGEDLDELQVVCIGQPLLIAGDLIADPAVIPCLAGKFCRSCPGLLPCGWEKARCYLQVQAGGLCWFM